MKSMEEADKTSGNQRKMKSVKAAEEAPGCQNVLKAKKSSGRTRKRIKGNWTVVHVEYPPEQNSEKEASYSVFLIHGSPFSRLSASDSLPLSFVTYVLEHV